ncbi:activating signal cointegrator 1 complex subunit 2 homolog [Drosophila subpulchrella]|uniref:activating signal cointegrator 1 complex subunit 2 homolog n=1 Tax=Drosophila subpulchrella TaxID=1486046 RepID=UPI0018A19995|nr:activating signal cointegrator 1 complex subunit 2 homolog [Drosophila subpulchrella]
MQIHRNTSALLVVFLAILAHCESRRTAYRLPRVQGRSASGIPAPQDVGSGRDLMKKFMMMRDLFQQPPSDNVIVLSQPSPSTTTTTTTTTGSPTTTTFTTTTTTPTTNSTARALQEIMHPTDPHDDDDDDEGQEIPVTMTMTGRALEDRLGLPEVQEEQEPQELDTHKQKVSQWPKKFRLKGVQLGRKRNLVKKSHRRVHKRPQKKKRHQKRKVNKKQSANQQRNSESAVNFIEPYHHDGQPKTQAAQSASDSRLQRIWRRFQIAN